ncbi:sortase A [Arthrobacter stackebrandtii]|uniref:Sortase A n=1 Tax=Arthrobacter stackebrandtii TaxID=272161 RepID=A0ABS4YW75_9MICC|nr:sortase A [Arthrobacter stackebrandtii]
MAPSPDHADSGVGVQELISGNERRHRLREEAARRQPGSRTGRARSAGNSPAGPGGRAGNRRSRQRPKQGFFRTLVQVLGELLITAGIVLLLFVVWELWWTNIEANSVQQQAVSEFARDFQGPLTPPDPGTPSDYGEPVVTAEPAVPGEVFGVAYIPRFGENYSRPLVEGVAPAQLDSLGLGRYDSSTMPGGVGNFAIAGHRQTHGAVLDAIHTLVPGDKIYIQTKDGYYTYVFRNNQIVMPDRADVLLPVPTDPEAVPTEWFLTMTSCNPRFGAEERIIAYSLLESWQPASAGPPSAIADLVAANQKG